MTLFPQIEDEIRHCQEEIAKKDRLLSKLSRQVIYTVGHKKRAPIIFSITLANIDGFS